MPRRALLRTIQRETDFCIRGLAELRHKNRGDSSDDRSNLNNSDGGSDGNSDSDSGSDSEGCSIGRDRQAALTGIQSKAHDARHRLHAFSRKVT
jgi:hypothetical protein